MANAATRFNNDLRYRDGDHEAQTQFTPSYILDPVRVTRDCRGSVVTAAFLFERRRHGRC